MLIIGVVVALAQVAQTAPGASGVARGHGECSAILVSSPQQPPSARSKTTFSAVQILDLRFGTVLRRQPTGPHLLELKVYTPRGHHYQTLAVPFAADGKPGGWRRVEGYPQPLAEQQTKTVSHQGTRAYEVSTSLPVGGTAIMTNSLYGKWRVEPYLDGSVCGQSATFEILP